MEFAKLHGNGNDFVLVDGRDSTVNWSQLSARVCDRHFGIGADGIIVALPSSAADLRMRIFNADGSEAEMCGNGIRCLAKFVVDRGLATARSTELAVETLAGVRHLSLFYERGGVEAVEVAMGQPHLLPQEIPVDPAWVATGDRRLPPRCDLEVEGRHLELWCLSMGNPHAVLFSDASPDEFPLARLGPLVEVHPAFPSRVNFSVVQQTADGNLRQRVWERGVGETLACGTGACASAVAARLVRGAGDTLDIIMRGGPLTVRWDGQGEVYMRGPVAMVFEGTLPPTAPEAP